MKSIALYGVLILTASLILGGMTNSAFAQDNPSILIKIAKRAQDQIQNQISSSTSEELKELFESGKRGVIALEESLSVNDMTSAKEHFLSTMKIFTEISRQLASNQSPQSETNTVQTPKSNPTNDLIRMNSYLQNLKTIAKNHSATIDFKPIDELFLNARNQINSNQFNEALQTIQEIKKAIIEINQDLRQQASQQETNRAQAFAQKYLKQVDRLIEHSQSIGKSEDVIQKLEDAKSNLSIATTPANVVKEVRNIMLLQQQYELSEGKLFEQRINQIEKTLLEISDSDQLNQETVQESQEKLQTIKDHLSKREYQQANELLKSLATILGQNQN